MLYEPFIGTCEHCDDPAVIGTCPTCLAHFHVRCNNCGDICMCPIDSTTCRGGHWWGPDGQDPAPPALDWRYYGTVGELSQDAWDAYEAGYKHRDRWVDRVARWLGI